MSLVSEKVSIEYAHIYLDEEFNEEQRISAAVMKDYVQCHPDAEVTKLIMVDDYSPKVHNLKISEFQAAMEAIDAKPDFYVYESSLIPYAHQMLSKVTNQRLYKNYKTYIDKRNGYIPCSLFITAWYAVRLGFIDAPTLRIPVSNIAITILPKRYERVESRAVNLIKHSEYTAAADRIQQLYFESTVSDRIPQF